MIRIGVIGSTCIDYIKIKNEKRYKKFFGGIIYITTALAYLFKNKGIIYPITKIEDKYRKDYIKIYEQYGNISQEGIYRENKKTNIVKLFYDENNKMRQEKSILESSSISYNEISPFLDKLDFLVITYISGYDINNNTLQRIRENYKKIIFGDIHSYIYKKESNKVRGFKTIKEPDKWIKNFDIVQGSELEWEILLRKRVKKSLLKEESINKKILIFREYYKNLNHKSLTALVTLGGDGAFLFSENNNYYVKGKKVKVVDTTGCGDTFSAAFIFSYLSGRSLKNSLKFANKIASRKALVRGLLF